MKQPTRSLKWSLPAACLLILGGVRVSAQVNLLPQVNFESPGANTGWAEGFIIPQNQDFQVILKNGKHWLRIENRDAGRQLDYVHAYVKVSPQIASLTISVRMRATNLIIGKEGWHTARVAMMFEGGSFGYPNVPELRADSDWVTKSVELKVPAGATRLNIQPAMFYCTGVFEIADLTVTPRLAAPTQFGDAVLPGGIALDWGETSVEIGHTDVKTATWWLVRHNSRAGNSWPVHCLVVRWACYAPVTKQQSPVNRQPTFRPRSLRFRSPAHRPPPARPRRRRFGRYSPFRQRPVEWAGRPHSRT